MWWLPCRMGQVDCCLMLLTVVSATQLAMSQQAPSLYYADTNDVKMRQEKAQ